MGSEGGEETVTPTFLALLTGCVYVWRVGWWPREDQPSACFPPDV